jgi:glycosyltransferase involved in cell wall biosynthesis
MTFSKPTKTIQIVAGMDQGGVERGTLEFALYMKNKGIDMHVASSGGQLVAELEAAGITHHTLPLQRRDPITLIYNTIKIIQLMNREKFKIAHARSRGPAWATYLACSFTKTPMITTFHGAHNIQNGLKRFYNSSMVRGERVIAVSKFMQEHILKNYKWFADESTIDVAPRGIDTEAFDTNKVSATDVKDIRQKYEATDADIVIALPGRITRLKGQSDFIKSLAILAEETTLPSWKAWIIGGAKGSKQTYLEELNAEIAAAGLSERIIFTGAQSNMPLFMKAADIVVSASTHPESFGRTTLEAEAMGTPVVATAHGGSLETVKNGETGYLSEPSNPESMTKMLRQLIINPEKRTTMGDNARKWAHNEFSTEATCEKEWACYKKVL